MESSEYGETADILVSKVACQEVYLLATTVWLMRVQIPSLPQRIGGKMKSCELWNSPEEAKLWGKVRKDLESKGAVVVALPNLAEGKGIYYTLLATFPSGRTWEILEVETE